MKDAPVCGQTIIVHSPFPFMTMMRNRLILCHEQGFVGEGTGSLSLAALDSSAQGHGCAHL